MTTSIRTVDGDRVLGLTWLVAAVPTAVVAFFLLVLSERTDDRVAGYVLAALALSGAALGGWLLTAGRDVRWTVSLGLSAVWAVAAVAVYPTMDFAADALWVTGVPLLAAAVTAALAWRSRH